MKKANEVKNTNTTKEVKEVKVKNTKDVKIKDVKEIKNVKIKDTEKVKGIKKVKFDTAEGLEGLKDLIKGLSNDELYGWAKELGIEVKDFPNPAIKRMRAAMSIKGHFFPTERKAKVESPWKKISTGELKKMAKAKKVEYRKSDNEQIQRMHLISALKVAGVNPEEK